MISDISDKILPDALLIRIVFSHISVSLLISQYVAIEI